MRRGIGFVLLLLASGACGFGPRMPRVPEPQFDDFDIAGWQRSNDSDLLGSSIAFVTDALPRGADDRWTLGGYIVDSGGARRATIWSSADGRSWEQDPIAEQVVDTIAWTGSPPNEVRIFEMAQHRGTRWAFGDEPYGDHRQPSIWRSVEGAMWERIGWHELITAGPGSDTQEIEDAFADDSGLTIVGLRVREDAPVAPAPDGGMKRLAQAGVWHSDDGARWTPVDDPIFASDERVFRAWAVAKSGDVTVVGGDDATTTSTDQIYASLWTSRGQEWSRIDDTSAGLSGPGSREIQAIAVRAGDFVAVGEVRRGGDLLAPAMWKSSDGQRWERVTTFASGHLPGSGLSVAVDGARTYVTTADRERGHLWTSTDLVRWTEVPLPPVLADLRLRSRLSVVAAHGELLVSTLTSDFPSSVWFRDSDLRWTEVTTSSAAFGPSDAPGGFTSVATSKNVIVAVGEGGPHRPCGRACGLWVSEDGRDWDHVVQPGLVATRFKEVAGAATGFIAIGTTDDASTTQMWASTDGREWTKVSAPSADLVAVERWGDQVVALGRRGGRPGLWTTADVGRRWNASVSNDRFVPRAICADGDTALVIGDLTVDKDRTAQVWNVRNDVWTRIDDPVFQKDRSTTVSDCAIRGDAVVLLGYTQGHAVLWHGDVRNSAFTEIETPANEDARPPETIFGVSAIKDGFGVFGKREVDGDYDIAVWTSRDGSNWTPFLRSPFFRNPGYEEIRDMAYTDDKVVLVGLNGTGAGVWTGPKD